MTSGPSSQRPLRLWPGVLFVAVQFVLFVVGPMVSPQNAVVGLLGGLGSGLLVVLWWLFFSRAPWLDRLGALLLMVTAILVNVRFVHMSIGGLGYFLPIPVYCLALVLWGAATRRMADGARRAWLVVVMLLACVPANLVRTDGITGDLLMQLAWRWTPTAEERLLAQGRVVPPAPVLAETPKPAPAAPSPENSPNSEAAGKTPSKKRLMVLARRRRQLRPQLLQPARRLRGPVFAEPTATP